MPVLRAHAAEEGGERERSDSCASGAYISSLHTLSLLHSIIRLYFERTACVIDVTQ